LIRANFLFAYRSIVSSRFYSLINILSLAAGLVCAVFIMLFINDEFSYDRHHDKHERIFRLESDFTISDRNQQAAKSPFPFGPAFKNEFPEVEEFVRFRPMGNVVFSYLDKDFFEDNVYFTDSTVFRVFTHRFIEGSPQNALNEPNCIVMTETFAKKYFGDKPALGKVISIRNGLECKVTGILEDVPENSHLTFDALISMVSLAHPHLLGPKMYHGLNHVHFWAIRLFTYVLVKENTDISGIHEKWPAFYEKNMADISKRLNGHFELLTTPLADIHLHSDLDWDLPTGNMSHIYLFSIIGVFILLIACINYMNLATARSAGKAKEVGIRKAVGAFRNQLIRLFLTESVFIAFIAFLAALFMVEVLLPAFNELAGKSLSFGLISHPDILLYSLLITIVVGVFSGSYPAFFLSSFVPVRVLKGRVNTGRKSGRLRRILIVFQFLISIVMILAAIVVTSQLNYMKNKNLGFAKKNIIVVGLEDSTFLKNFEPFRNRLLQNPNVRGVSTSSLSPGGGAPMDVMLVEQDLKMQEQLISLITIDDYYMQLMDMQIITGRGFDPQNHTDPEEVVLINETAAAKFNWGDNAIGKKIERRETNKNCKVVGVVKDFNFASLHSEIGPIVFFLNRDPNKVLHIKISEDNVNETITLIENIWHQYNPHNPFLYIFLEEPLNELYAGEANLQRIIAFFSILSILIALTGLFGLSSFICEQYTKEIGIRKTLGAKISQIFYLLSNSFLKLVFIAFILAVPVSWYGMDLWLANYAYPVDVKVWWFAYTLAAALVIALLTVSFQAYRSATRNPVEALRYD